MAKFEIWKIAIGDWYKYIFDISEKEGSDEMGLGGICSKTLFMLSWNGIFLLRP